jgi:hypothetical protein
MMTRFLVRAIFLLPVVIAWGDITAVAQNSPEFSLALSPASVTLPQGAVTSFTLTLESNERPSFSVSLTGLPDGVQVQTPVVRGGIGTVVLYASPDATVGSFAVQVTVRAGNTSQTQILTLNVKPMQPVPQWEYTVLAANTDEEFLSLANSLGSQGWELVSVRFSELTAPSFVGFFKRIKR